MMLEPLKILEQLLLTLLLLIDDNREFAVVYIDIVAAINPCILLLGDGVVAVVALWQIIRDLFLQNVLA